MQDPEKPDELVSALADGQLLDQEFARTVERVAADDAARLTWHSYHLVGDVLRCGESVLGQNEAAFAQRVMLRLAQELPHQPSLQVSDLPGARALPAGTEGLGQREAGAANAASFRWKALAGFASLVTVAMLGWQAWEGPADAVKLARVLPQTGTGPVAVQQTPSAAAQEPPIMIRDSQLDALLAAHRQTGGHSALEMSGGFLRNATFEGAARSDR